MADVTFEGFVIETSPKAVLFHGHYWDIAVWLPMSQITVTNDDETSKIVKVRGWLAKKNNLVEFCHLTEDDLQGARNG